MRITKTILALMTILIAIGCEKVIDINIPEGERKIVINGLINPDSLVKVNISRSLSVLEDNEFVFLESANVKLFQADNEIGKLSYMGSGFYMMPDFKPVEGADYLLTVDSEGLRSVSAIAAVKNPIEFSDLDTITVYNEWGGSILEVGFSLIDPHEENFYAIGVNESSRLYDWETETYSDSIITYASNFQMLESDGEIQNFLLDQGAYTFFGNKVFFSDELFNGKEFDVSIGLWKSFYGADTVNVEVYLEHVSKPYYYYAVSSGKHNEMNGNPFGEPVSVYTNVENGLGIFSGYSSSKKNLTIVGSGRE